jgi:hypothetical protein
MRRMWHKTQEVGMCTLEVSTGLLATRDQVDELP